MVENQYFRELIEFSGTNNRDLLQPAILERCTSVDYIIESLVVNADIYLPKCSDTIRSWIIDEFGTRKRSLQDELAEAESLAVYSS